jgi:hypothetical protein
VHVAERPDERIHFSFGVVMAKADADETSTVAEPEALYQRNRVEMSVPDEDILFVELVGDLFR